MARRAVVVGAAVAVTGGLLAGCGAPDPAITVLGVAIGGDGRSLLVSVRNDSDKSAGCWTQLHGTATLKPDRLDVHLEGTLSHKPPCERGVTRLAVRRHQDPHRS